MKKFAIFQKFKHIYEQKKKYRTRSEFISVRFLIKMHRIVSEPMNFFFFFFWKIKKKALELLHFY